MIRSTEPEWMDFPTFAPTRRGEFHRELARLNRILGNTQMILRRLRQDPPASVVDIGCGEGALLAEIYAQFGSKVIGVDLHKRPCNPYQVPIIVADGTADGLPESDVALCILTAHHLTEAQVVGMVRNVGRSSRRFLILDLVRHPLPLALYSVFLRPVVSRLVMLDGQQSIRRAFTPDEMKSLVVEGLKGSDAIFEHWVSPIYGKQLIDIRYRR